MRERTVCYTSVNSMRKTTALTLGLLLLLSFLFFMSPVGRYVVGTPFSGNPEPPPPPRSEQLSFELAEGFAAHLFAENVPGARVMHRDPKGTLLVSETSQGKIVALPNLDSDGKADRLITVLDGLNNPHGLLMLCPDTGNVSADQDVCLLYVAETHRVAAYAYDADTYSATFEKTLINLPDDGGHFTRTLMLHPDNKRILVSVGSSCNVCMENDERRATVLAIDLEIKKMSVFATGLRNTVFMTTHYVTGDIWGTDMGRDYLGDDLPPDEINIIRPSTSLGVNNYGWPFCYGKGIRDSTFRSDKEFDCTTTDTSHLDIPAHSAPLGIAFVPEEGWPEEMWYDALVAYHGSWNRSTPTGYRVVRFPLDAEGNPEGGPQDFMTGFMNERGTVIGRPVDILLEPGGVMFVSDDKAGVIYRIARTGA